MKRDECAGDVDLTGGQVQSSCVPSPRRRRYRSRPRSCRCSALRGRGGGGGGPAPGVEGAARGPGLCPSPLRSRPRRCPSGRRWRRPARPAGETVGARPSVRASFPGRRQARRSRRRRRDDRFRPGRKRVVAAQAVDDVRAGVPSEVVGPRRPDDRRPKGGAARTVTIAAPPAMQPSNLLLTCIPGRMSFPLGRHRRPQTSCNTPHTTCQVSSKPRRRRATLSGSLPGLIRPSSGSARCPEQRKEKSMTAREREVEELLLHLRGLVSSARSSSSAAHGKPSSRARVGDHPRASDLARTAQAAPSTSRLTRSPSLNCRSARMWRNW